MTDCHHHYEFSHGHFVCRYCGNIRASRHKNRRLIKQLSIIAGVSIIGFFIYQEYVVTGTFQKDSNDLINNFKIIPSAQNIINSSFNMEQTPSLNVTPIQNQSHSMSLKFIPRQTVQQISNFSDTIQGMSREASQIGQQLNPDPMKTKPVIDIPILEQKIHTLINLQRTQNQLKPLVFDSQLAVIARGHSQDMATRNYFEHDTPEGISFSDRYKQAGYTCEKRFNVSTTSYSIMEGGENIYQNNLYDSYETINGVISHYDWNDMDKIASSTVNGWMNSQGHRENILTAIFDSEGIGVVISSDDKVYITEDFC